MEGRELAVLGRCKRACQLHLLLILPCESRSLIRASWTDLQLRMGAACDTSSSASPALLATIKDLFNARTAIDAVLGRMADARRSTMQLELVLEAAPEAAQALWEQFEARPSSGASRAIARSASL